ncbi:Uma2 family endonuclease [Fimbriiglobus ruber]|uniref:Uma2 family endonuclease n=1 Tax=Fimbriiglobus ruber TaxID=1908690 RepID=UPI0013797CD7|nr:Uma2 family endonuclease [Fimbriiglobus ruber]
MGKTLDRATTAIPPLRDGDRLTRDEFIRRYEASKDVLRAELIQGVVYVNARVTSKGGQAVTPISFEAHSDPLFDIGYWLGTYAYATPGTKASTSGTLYAPSPENAPEPDTSLRILPDFGGRTKPDKKGFLHGALELVVEVANTTAGRDLGPKMLAYQEDGVPEYIVWRTAEAVIDWFVLKRKKYVPLAPDADGILQSQIFPGLWLDPVALLNWDMPRVLAILQQGLASPEHATFVAKLATEATRRKKK